MSEYKRLTNKDWKENYDIFDDVCCDTCTEDCGECERNFNALVRLAELEDKIENGTLIELPFKVGDMIYNKNIKFYLNSKEIPFEELSKLPQMTTDRENHTITEVLLNYIDKDAIFFYTKTECYTVLDGSDKEYYDEM